MGINRRDSRTSTSRAIVIVELRQQGNRGRLAVVGEVKGTGRYISQRALIIYAIHAAVFPILQRDGVSAETR
jgi:hypothetical protein